MSMSHWKTTIGALALGTCAACASLPEEDSIERSQQLLVEEVAGDHPQCGLRPDILAEADTNGDDAIDDAERSAFISARKAELLAEYDADHDGVLDPEERAAVRADRRARRFEALDVNDDGVLSRDEATAGCPVAKRFDALDTDGDGVVSAVEFANGTWPRRPHERRHRR